MKGQACLNQYFSKGLLSPFDAYLKIKAKAYPLAAFKIGSNIKLMKPTTNVFNTAMIEKPELFVGVYDDSVEKRDFFNDLEG